MENMQTKQTIDAITKFRQSCMHFGDTDELTMRELSVLKMISVFSEKNDNDTPKQCARVTDLSDSLGLSKSNMSQILNILEDKNLIERITTKDDRRVVRVEVTESGGEQLRKSFDSAEQLLDEVARRVGNKDMDKFVFLLNKISGILREIKNTGAEDII